MTGSQLQGIEVTPPASTRRVGNTVDYVATGIYADGLVDDMTRDVTWSSGNPAVVSISNAAASKGVATPMASGSTQITATFGGVSGGTVLTISGASLLGIELSPFDSTLPADFTQQMVATAMFSDGRSEDVTGQVTWNSGNAPLASVSNAAASKGVARGVAPGTALITARAGATTGGTSLTISGSFLVSIDISPPDSSLAPGFSRQLTATATLSDGSSMDVTRFVTWTTSDTAIAQVSNTPSARGRATAVAPGTVQVGAQLDGLAAATTLTVPSASLSSIELFPVAPTFPPGFTKQCTAVGHFSDGSTQDVTDQVTWSTSDAAVAQVSNAAGSRGVARTIAPGTAEITAGAAGVAGSTTLTVSSAF